MVLKYGIATNGFVLVVLLLRLETLWGHRASFAKMPGSIARPSASSGKSVLSDSGFTVGMAFGVACERAH